jgi:hypothetical protein
LAEGLREIDSDTYDYEIEPRDTGRIEFSVLKSKTFWRAIYSKRTKLLLEESFGVSVALNRDNLLQLRRMNEATPDFPLHNDFIADNATIASFFYISPNWSAKCGGCLHLFESGKQARPSVSIEPIGNRFVAFETKPSHWHSVERVYGWERLSVLSLWNVDDNASDM